MYSRILLKLSGEALSGGHKDGILDSEALLKTAKAVKAIVEAGSEVSIVIGAGNIARGSLVEKTGIDRVSGDYMGMLGTVMNGLSLYDAFKRLQTKQKMAVIKSKAASKAKKVADEALKSAKSAAIKVS